MKSWSPREPMFLSAGYGFDKDASDILLFSRTSDL